MLIFSKYSNFSKKNKNIREYIDFLMNIRKNKKKQAEERCVRLYELYDEKKLMYVKFF